MPGRVPCRDGPSAWAVILSLPKWTQPAKAKTGTGPASRWSGGRTGPVSGRAQCLGRHTFFAFLHTTCLGRRSSLCPGKHNRSFFHHSARTANRLLPVLACQRRSRNANNAYSLGEFWVQRHAGPVAGRVPCRDGHTFFASQYTTNPDSIAQRGSAVWEWRLATGGSLLSGTGVFRSPGFWLPGRGSKVCRPPSGKGRS